MTKEEKPFKIDWSWGFIGLLGILGYVLEQPVFYAFFIFSLFFLVPIIRKIKK